MVKIVNVVGSGSLDAEFDLERVASDIGSLAEYDPSNYPGMYIRLKENSPLITLYRTGKYIITAAKSKNEAYAMRKKFLKLLYDYGMISAPDDKWFQIQNFVCTAKIHESLNLDALTIILGLENTEYEPEQFSGLIYRPSETNIVFLIFANGRVVITGGSDIDLIEEIFATLVEKINNARA